MTEHEDHQRKHRAHHGEQLASISVGLLTISDTRTPETDRSAQLLREGLEAAGHQVVWYRIVPDEPEQIRQALQEGLPTCQALLSSGGTGIAHRDRSYEAISGLFDKTLDGFGEIFRMLSYEQVGAAAYLSRATAGVIRGVVVFVLPGSTGAVSLALDKLILPELGHLCRLLGESA